MSGGGRGYVGQIGGGSPYKPSGLAAGAGIVRLLTKE